MNETQKEWLLTLLAILSLLLLWGFHFSFNHVVWLKFLIDISPSLGANLLAFIIIYFTLKKQGIINRNKTKIIDEKTNTILKKVDKLDSKLNTITEGIGCIEKFHENFYDYDWQNLIESAEKEIVIVVYYFDSWLKNNKDYLEKFFRKPDTEMIIILSNPDKNNNLETIKRLFKEHSESALKEKIENTKKRAINIINCSGASANRLKIYLYPYHLNYAIQSFDRNKVTLSMFETFREDRVQSPIFLLNLNNSEKTKNFIDKEIKGLIKESETLTLNN